MRNELQEACGVFGVFQEPNERAAEICYQGLFSLQHRGQESAGIAVSNGRRLRYYKDQGLVQQVFDRATLHYLRGQHGIGHVRYSTTGSSRFENAQPLVSGNGQGELALVHNGNLVNTTELRQQLPATEPLQSTTDSELILHLLLQELDNGSDLPTAVERLLPRLAGGFAVLLLTATELVAFRDPEGLRPLCVGKRGTTWFLASESCALSAVEADYLFDVAPGEILHLSAAGLQRRRSSAGQGHLCAFEFVYFARTDSVIDGLSVYRARLNLGAQLYREAGVRADVVVDVPDSGTVAALGYSYESGIPLAKGFYRNAYIGRTFIKPHQELRDQGVRAKLAPIAEVVRGQELILVDDSLVRGTTMRNIVASLRRAGARAVHVMISSPPVQFGCYYGIDTPDREQLIAAHREVEEIRRYLGADSLHYLSPAGLMAALAEAHVSPCLACFTGVYPVALRKETTHV